MPVPPSLFLAKKIPTVDVKQRMRRNYILSKVLNTEGGKMLYLGKKKWLS